MFQSTHPHGVRLWSVVKPKEEEKVSIHAPTRGATTWSLIRRSLTKGFNPRTHTGCDLQSEKHPLRIPFGFNPRTHTGCDFIRFRISISSSVSIHAPTRGATSNDNCFLNATRVSIHAPTRGATDRYVWPVNSSLFQSTHPHGVRPFSSSLVQDVKSFNPRTHTGCDRYAFSVPVEPPSFNPRTHTGCDSSQYCIRPDR